MSDGGPVVLAPLAAPRSTGGGGIAVTPGEGPIIATERVDGEDYQVVKAVVGASGVLEYVSLGQQVAGASLPVVLASDSSGINVVLPDGAATEDLQLAGNVLLTSIESRLEALETGQATANSLLAEIELNTASSGAATAVHTNVAASLTSVTLLAANAGRRGATVYNDSTAEMLLRLGMPVSATDFTLRMGPESFFEVPFNWIGAITGMWTAATGTARIEELSA